MKYAIMGGTFNPLHYGHLFLAEEVKNILEYDYIIFVPAFQPAHKTVDYAIAPQHRYNMVKMAIEPYSYFLIDDCELKRGGISYMIDTVSDIQKRYEKIQTLGIIIGDDLIQQFPKWKNAHELASRTEIIIAKRTANKKIQFDYPHVYLNNKLISISASEIRERVKAKQSARFLLPDNVYEYVQEHRLYC
jgi:nicotinate-nucleotide adenylyltransferase